MLSLFQWQTVFFFRGHIDITLMDCQANVSFESEGRNHFVYEFFSPFFFATFTSKWVQWNSEIVKYIFILAFIASNGPNKRKYFSGYLISIFELLETKESTREQRRTRSSTANYLTHLIGKWECLAFSYTNKRPSESFSTSFFFFFYFNKLI